MTGTYLIYGGNGGIGAATARALVAKGKSVHLAGRDAAGLAALSAEIGGHYSVGDLSEAGAILRITEEAQAATGQLSGLIYAVGTINLRLVTQLTAVDFQRDFEVNALWAVQAIQAAIPALKKSEGTAGIVLFSTIAVSQGFTAHASVSMAKGAVEGLTRALAAELAPKIRVNCIAPSLTRTKLAGRLIANAAVADGIASLHALQRLGRPEDIAPLAAMLACEEGGWITGQIIGVDGGRSSLRTKG